MEILRYLFSYWNRAISAASLVLSVISIIITIVSWTSSESKSNISDIILFRDPAIIGVLVVVTGALLTTLLSSREIVRRVKRIKKTKELYPKLSIVGIIREKRSYQTRSALIILLVFLITYTLLSGSVHPLDDFVVIVLGILISLLVIGQIIFDYRVQNGFYGKNEGEAREIIQFIIQESSHIDFTDDGKLKSIISEEDLKKIEQVATRTVPGTVG